MKSRYPPSTISATAAAPLRDEKPAKTLPYGRQHITEEDIQSVVEVLRSDWLTQGPTIDRFERAVAEYCGCKYAVATNSATSALHIAALASGLGRGDKLWTSPNTFVASANCALYCGAGVDFVDIDPRTYNLSVSELSSRLARASRDGTLPKVIVPVHFAGQSCEMQTIVELAREHGIVVIEDASHGIGGSYLRTKVGSCAYSDMAVFSFHPVKIITTGEGGLILTNRDDLYAKLRLLRSHGITRSEGEMVGSSHGPWYYEQVALGYNYRMTDIEAALGLSQLQRIDEIVTRRQFLAKRYDELLSSLPVTTPWQHPDTYSAFHLYVIRLKLDLIAKSHRQVFEELRAAGILVNLHYIPVHTQPYYQRLGFKAGQFPNAESYYAEAITLPLYFGLTDSEQDFVAEQLSQLLS